MKNVVITGSTRGIGLGLAEAFLKQGCSVVVSSRNREKLSKVVVGLKAKYKNSRVSGCPCDVTVYDQVQQLWDHAKAELGVIDIWINNAGIAHSFDKLWNLEPEELQAVVNTNLTGSLNGCRVAVKGMLKQGSGWLYNMEGAGSDGTVRPGLSLYGTTKYAVHYLGRALKKELQQTPVQSAVIMPGMVVTDLLIGGMETMEEKTRAAFRKTISILADSVETTAVVLVKKILKNRKSGVCIRRLSFPALFMRFVFAGFRKRDLVAEFYQEQYKEG